jgi:hypothetical protein
MLWTGLGAHCEKGRYTGASPKTGDTRICMYKPWRVVSILITNLQLSIAHDHIIF